LKHLTSHDWALIEEDCNESAALIAPIAKNFFIFDGIKKLLFKGVSFF
jgi:hypothetical protein